MEPGETAEAFRVSGRGTLHLGILIENMRREGYEFEIGPPKVRGGKQDYLRLMRHVILGFSWGSSRGRSDLQLLLDLGSVSLLSMNMMPWDPGLPASA